MARNFVGADEALVDGLVRRTKTSVLVGAPAAAKAELSEALLGIIRPEILRSKEKAGAKREGTEARRQGNIPQARKRSRPDLLGFRAMEELLSRMMEDIARL